MDISAEINIAAPPERVWQVLADFAAYPSWNPFIEKIEAQSPLAPGQHLSVTIHPPGKKPMTFSPVILAASPDNELRWLGRVVHPMIFAGEHRRGTVTAARKGVRTHECRPEGPGRGRLTYARRSGHKHPAGYRFCYGYYFDIETSRRVRPSVSISVYPASRIG